MTTVWLVLTNSVPTAAAVALKDALGVQWEDRTADSFGDEQPTGRVYRFEHPAGAAEAKRFVDERAHDLIAAHGVVVGIDGLPMLPRTP